MIEHLNQILFVVGLVTWIGWVLFKRYINPDLDHHEASPPPTEEQLRWHVWNMRKDLSMLAVTNFAILLVLVFSLVLKL
jgi:hypothetical protein